MARLPKKVMKQLRPVYEAEWKELSSNWDAIERKAQLAGGAAAALLTGLLGLAGSERLRMPGSLYWILAAIATVLFISMSCSLAALWISSQTLPPPGEMTRKLAWQLQAADPDSCAQKFAVESLHQQIVEWDQACKDLHTANEMKGTRVLWAQTALVLAGALTLALIVAWSVAMRNLALGGT
jgi:hypothetical protein